MLRKNRVLFSSLIILVISTFLLSGCGGSKSGKGGGVDGGDPSVLHDFIGTWVSEGLNPQVTVTINSMIGDITKDPTFGGYYVFYTGSVQCDELIGTVFLTEANNDICEDYIVGNYATGELGKAIYIRVSADSVSLTGNLINSSTMLASDLDKELFNYSGEYVTFNKQ